MLVTRHALAQRFGLIKDPFRMFKGHSARFRQPHSAFRANEQRLAKFRLQGFNLMTDGGLGQI
jgi:hypothetical protein